MDGSWLVCQIPFSIVPTIRERRESILDSIRLLGVTARGMRVRLEEPRGKHSFRMAVEQ